jgi:hypothetical protein
MQIADIIAAQKIWRRSIHHKSEAQQFIYVYSFRREIIMQFNNLFSAKRTAPIGNLLAE